ncbi:hypothetical protein ACVSQB_37665 [Bradyrhizobium elkanii]
MKQNAWSGIFWLIEQKIYSDFSITNTSNNFRGIWTMIAQMSGLKPE